MNFAHNPQKELNTDAATHSQNKKKHRFDQKLINIFFKKNGMYHCDPLCKII